MEEEIEKDLKQELEGVWQIAQDSNFIAVGFSQRFNDKTQIGFSQKYKYPFG